MMMAHSTNTLVSSSALSPIYPDAEMIATCAAICENERAYDATGVGHETGSPEETAAEQERERISARQDALVQRLCDLPCRTLAGVQALARALAAWDRELLKDGPARDNGEVITANLVERLLALPVTEADADADLLAVCAEFCASEAAFSQICEADPELSEDEHDAAIAPILRDWHRQLERMAAFRATTHAGLAARALALAQHSGIKPGCTNYTFSFIPNKEQGGITGRLLHMLLSDGMQVACGAPPPNPDAELLALRPEFDRLHAAAVAFNQRPGECDIDLVNFDDLCKQIMAAIPAITGAGRAFQAAAAMHQMYYRLDVRERGTDPIWLMLKAIAGDTYKPVETQP